MSGRRVKRSEGPRSKMTKATYRKKALPYLLKDFDRHCAYCLDPSDFRSPSENHIDHFDCKLRERQRHQYKNLMLACSACNISKHDKPVVNPFDSDQRLLNCTEENEFPTHIVEAADGRWHPVTKAGEYHIESIELNAECHRNKRSARRRITEEILKTCTTAIQYRATNPRATHDAIMNMLRLILNHLNSFPPLVTDRGLISASDWLRVQGVDTSLLSVGHHDDPAKG